ncbi:MAG TPA: hypothetical protein VGF25_09180 [Thermoleophilaceae bacterium]|jgi:hypothetical protein
MEALTPEQTPARLCELSADARAAVLLDAAGALAGSSEDDPDRARALGEMTRELMEAVDAAGGEPAEQVEVQVPGGAVYASRNPRWTLAVVARRSALSSLMLWDLRAVLGELDGAPPIRRAVAVEPAQDGPATEEAAAGESPVPELGAELEP